MTMTPMAPSRKTKTGSLFKESNTGGILKGVAQ
jgi:hypothetical protein